MQDETQTHFTESTGEDGTPDLNLTQEKIKQRTIEEEMKSSYIDYAMSVIVGRALPDVRDGLKPVHRRILYGMHEAGLASNKPYKKSARTVGDVMAKYHPHGDSAIYDTMVRMAQDFSLRYPLVDGQGNFGSIDGDNAAAMRYTEARLQKIAEEMLADIDRETVDKKPNYDESLMEPTVLPCKLPNLLINGSSGIAVGMATNMAPHNLTEVVDGIIHLIDNPDVETPDLMEFVKGPDFPTGGIINGISGIYSAYLTGRGRVRIRGRTGIEEMKKGKQRIVITEIPYMVNKSRLIENIANLIKDKRVDGITDLRDESDREGMRVVIELRRDVIADVILNQLYKHTQLESVFGIINLVLVNGRPEVLPLKRLMQEFVKHRVEVVVRRTEFELRKAKDRCHILEGLIVALGDIDNVIAIIKKSANAAEASIALQERYELTPVQTKAILEMRLQKLTSLETEAIKKEHAALLERIAELESILADRQKVLDIIKVELIEMRDKYGNDRRTEIDETEIDLDIEDLIPNETVVITRTHGGYVKRITLDTYRQQRRGGKGLMGMDTKEEDYVEEMFVTRSHNFILIFTTHGKVYWLKGYRIPETGRRSRGKAIVNMLPGLDEGEKVNAMIPVEEFGEDRNLIFATKKGVVKKTPLMAYSRPRTTGIWAIRLDDGDDLLTVRLSDGDMNVFVTSSGGRAVLFSEKELRAQGRATRGVRGIRLNPGEEVVSMISVEEDSTILTITERGFGKRTAVEKYRKIKRGGKGVYTIKTSERNGKVVAVRDARDDQELIVTTKEGMVIRTPVNQIKEQGRNTMGVRIMKMNEGDIVTSVVVRTPEEDELTNGEEPEEGEEGDDGVNEEARSTTPDAPASPAIPTTPASPDDVNASSPTNEASTKETSTNEASADEAPPAAADPDTE